MWNLLIVEPMTNALLFIYSILGHNFGLAIIVFTMLVRLLTHPLTASQLKSTAAMQDLNKSDEWKSIQEKYKDDKEKLGQEQMKLYKKAGVNPFGSCLPTLVQFPIIIGLYQAIIAALATTPLQLLTFAEHIYKLSADSFLYKIFPTPASIVPLNSSFLWMDLGLPERLQLPFLPATWGIPVLAILVVITSFLQTRLMTPPSANPNDQTAMMGKAMGIYFPLFIGYLTMTYASGLGLYFVVSNVSGILQYAALGRLDWSNVFPRLAPAQQTAPKNLPSAPKKPAAKAPARQPKSTKNKKARSR